MLKKIMFLSAIALAVAGIAHADQANKVLICHATSSTTNPIVMISVSQNAVEAQLAEGSTVAKMLPDGSYTCTVEIVPE